MRHSSSFVTLESVLCHEGDGYDVRLRGSPVSTRDSFSADGAIPGISLVGLLGSH
jgi:hypothetical protein